jgi:ferric-dicitrate binding protein FerR (iron transport regulator)
MDDLDLINEVLELTLAYQRGDATAEERARLERLLLDNPQAIDWYLRIVDDSLTLRAAASAHEAQPPVAGLAGELHEAAAGESACERLLRDVVVQSTPEKTLFAAIRDTWRVWAVPSAAAAFLFVVAGWLWWSLSISSLAQKPLTAAQAARVVNVSNVEWSAGAKTYDEWSFLEPGETLKFERGLVNLFLDNGAELLIEGPADVDYVSIEKVFARKGKLAARVSPGAIGFSIETPHANVIDRGTSFGMSVDENSRTDVVVYEGKVDLDVMGDNAPPRRRLERGEALSVNRQGILSRITTVESTKFLEPPQVRLAGGGAAPVITAVSDNVRSLETAKYYRVIPDGFREDCRAYVDRLHEWNGVDERGMPPFLLGGDYVMTFNDDKITTEIEIAVTLGQPAALFVVIDDRVPPPSWLMRDFVDTRWDIGSDDGWGPGEEIQTGLGAGISVERACSIWRRDVTAPSTVILGALSEDKPPEPADKVGRSMYGIVAIPLDEAHLPRAETISN